MQEAVNAYDTGWRVALEQQRPVHIQVLCRVNKLTAQGLLAEMKQDAALADEVADEFEVIIECFPQAFQPLCLKHCEEMMAKLRKMVETSAA